MVTLAAVDRHSPDIPAMRRVNDEAFPENERISVDDFFYPNGLVRDCLGIYHDGQFAGFFLLLKHGACVYISYLAIDAAFRSQGIGGEALKLLTHYYPGMQIVVDFESVDVPGGNLAQRQHRRSFYLRNGYRSTGIYMYYMQTEFEVAWTGRDNFDEPAFLALVDDLHSHVSDFSPRIYRKD